MTIAELLEALRALSPEERALTAVYEGCEIDTVRVDAEGGRVQFETGVSEDGPIVRGYDGLYECARCGSGTIDVGCGECGGNGKGCAFCAGRGYFTRCAVDEEWCELHPQPGCEDVPTTGHATDERAPAELRDALWRGEPLPAGYEHVPGGIRDPQGRIWTIT